MAEWSFPYGSVNHDRRYKSSDFRSYYAQLIGNGVFYTNSTALKVSEGGGMNITLAKGSAFIEGVGYINTAGLNFTLDTADGALPRIDRLVIRNDYTNRETYAAILKGSYSAQPQAVAITRNADCYEIAIADILVPGGAVSIAQANITDNRLNNDLCGVVTGLIEQADTTEIFNQFEAYLTEFKQQYIAEMENWTEVQEDEMTAWMREQKADFLLWVDEIKDILDETVAGHLQVEIEKVKAELSEDAFKRFYGLVNQVSEWMPDGSIVVTNAEATLTVAKGINEYGYKVIAETIKPVSADLTYTKTTTFYPKTSSTNKKIVEAYSYELE